MKAQVRLVDEVCLMGSADSGHGIIMDGAPEIGGRNLGTRPMEMVLIGLGGCTAMDVLSILKKQRQTVESCVIDIEAERSEQVPKVFTKIHLHFTVTGRDLKESQVKRAINLSAEKYCSVSAMLEKTAQISHDYTVIENAVGIEVKGE